MSNSRNVAGHSKGHSKAKYSLQLFITGATPNSSRAVANIRAICEQYLKDNYKLEIIDVYLERRLAGQKQIVALPMLIKAFPLPERKLIGDMSKTQKVLEALGI
jgi:circadian clock protein KaiB